jgi:hypothetical protein
MVPINVVANVRGKRYEVSAGTVQEVCNQVESLTGISCNEQNVLYKGKVLNSVDKLEDMGISAGEVLNVVKGRKVRPAPSTSATAGSKAVKSHSPPQFDPKELRADPEKLKEAMNAMDNLLDSNAIEEYFADEDRIEEARQQMIDNIDQYEQMMPGFKEQALEIASDPAKWKEAMSNAKQQLLRLKQERDNGRAKKEPQQPLPQNPADSGVDDIDDEDQ